MHGIGVWDLIDLPDYQTDYKWVFKTKRIHKVTLSGLNLGLLENDSLSEKELITMIGIHLYLAKVLQNSYSSIAHFDLELYQMDVELPF